MNDKLIKAGISQGDINGVAYELIIKIFEDVGMFDFCIPVLYGSSKVLAYYRKMMEFPAISVHAVHHAGEAIANRLNIMDCGDEDPAVELSKVNQKSAEQALQRAVSDLKAGLIDVLVLAPSNINETQNLSQLLGKSPLKILVYNSFRIALASDQIPLANVSSLLSVDWLVAQIKALHASLIHDFMITFPRIAVLSFNPDMGINERKAGEEETKVIIPAIEAANKNKITCFGPYSGAAFFADDDYMKFDAVLAIYNDQGVIPFRSISDNEGACHFAGYPFVITAPDQSISYSKAGKNETSENSFRNAIYLGIDIFRTKKLNVEIYANPLKKQYFEKGSDNEKLDLTKDED